MSTEGDVITDAWRDLGYLHINPETFENGVLFKKRSPSMRNF